MTTTINNEHKELNFSSEREQSQTCLNSAEHEKNQGRKVLYVPNKREQNQTCLDSTEREGLRPKGNVPNLRFPEFQEEWEESTIGEEFDLYSGNTPSRLNKEHFNGAINWISSGELKEHYIAYTKEKISDEAAKNLKMLPIGTFVIAIYGLEADGVRGTGSITKTEATISQACMAFISKGKVQNEFLYSWYKKHGNVIGIRYAQGTKQQNLSYDIIEKFKIAYPTFQEQEKLNKFIALLDERIATQNKVIDKLQSLIKGIRNKLFENDKDWRKAKIREFLCIGNGKDYKHLDIGDIPVYGTGGKMLSVNDFLYDGDSVCIGRKGTIDTPLFLTGKFWTVDTLFYTYGFKDVLPKFCYYLFKQINWQLYNEGTGVPSLSKSTIENIKVRIPSIIQQYKICYILDCYEDKIKNEGLILDLYCSQKQYLLRKMFV